MTLYFAEGLLAGEDRKKKLLLFFLHANLLVWDLIFGYVVENGFIQCRGKKGLATLVGPWVRGDFVMDLPEL